MSHTSMYPFNDEYTKHIYTQHKHQLPPEKPKPLTIGDLLPNLDRWSIGYTSTFQGLQELAKGAKTTSYPPYNVKQFEDGTWRIDMALAGFRKDDLEIKVQDNTLTIKSNYKETEEERQELKDALVLHNGIAKRAFTTNFAIAEYVEVKDASLQDGILTIKLKQELPEEKKPKYIEIN